MYLKLSAKIIESEFVRKIEEISAENLMKCNQCGKCSAGCPSISKMESLPNQLIRRVQLGDESVLERNWSGTRHVRLKSVLALLVQEPDSKLLKYSNAEIKHADMADAILEFIDFYKSDNAKINCLMNLLVKA